MGFYFRKSVSLGGVRLNFSRSGIGISAGVKGMRVGVGNNGGYVHAGRNGFYYRKNFSSFQNSANSQKNDNDEASLNSDSDYLNIAQQVEKNRHKFIFWPLALLLAFIPKIGIICAIIAALIIFLLIDKKIKKVPVMYEISNTEDFLNWRMALCELSECKQIWSVIETEEEFLQKKIKVSFVAPREISTNVDVLKMQVFGGKLYFFPDFILIINGRKISCVSYENLILEQQNMNITQTDGNVPADAKIMSYVWAHVTKAGEPDKRYSYNPQYPILLYSILSITSTNGFFLQLMFSRPEIGKKLIKQLKQQEETVSQDIPNTVKDDFLEVDWEDIDDKNNEFSNTSKKRYIYPEDDNLVREALKILLSERKASASYIQRRLKISYNRAADIMDLFEERGIVSPPSDSGAKRDILIDIFDIGAEELNYDSDYDEAFFDFKDNVKKEKRISEENSNNSVLAVVDSLLQHDDDEKMPYAIIYAIFTEKITVKDLYKHLEIGYARAAKLIDQMEVRGILDHPYSEDEVIFRKSKIFNYTDINNPPPDFAEDKQSKQEQKSSPKNEEKSKSPETDYYKILGVLPSATGVEIKKAWRKMVLEFHPDKVQGSGLSQDFLDFASEKLRKINEAYEEICKLRDDCR